MGKVCHNADTPTNWMVDLWDAIQIVADLPNVKGGSLYAKTYRSIVRDTYEKLMSQTIVDGETYLYNIPVNRFKLLEDLKAQSLYHIHEASFGSEEAKELHIAAIDALSTIYDRFWEEL